MGQGGRGLVGGCDGGTGFNNRPFRLNKVYVQLPFEGGGGDLVKQP